MRKLKVAFNGIFDRIQLGMGTAGGAETVLYVVNSSMQLSEQSLVATFDLANAFNQRKRMEIARALYADERTSIVWRTFSVAYGQENVAIVYDADGKCAKRIRLCEGVEQGDLLAQFAFDLSMQRVYERSTDNSNVITSVAVHDDFTGVGTVQSILGTSD